MLFGIIPTMPSMTGFEFGTIVLVRFPFTDQRGSKQRPAVVVSSAAYNQARPDVILMAVTSRLRHRPDFGEIDIDDWQAAGLLKTSAIKPVLFTMEQKLVVRTLGRLKERDQAVLRKNLQSIFG